MSGAILRNREGLFVATFFSRIAACCCAKTCLREISEFCFTTETPSSQRIVQDDNLNQPNIKRGYSHLRVLSASAVNVRVVFHHRDAEYAVFGIFLVQELFTPRPPRLGGEWPSCFSPRRRRGSQRDLLLQRRNRMISIQHLKRSTSASMTRENFAPVALPEVREKWSTSTDATR